MYCGAEALLPVFHMHVGSSGVLGHLKYQQLESYAIAVAENFIKSLYNQLARKNLSKLSRPQMNYPARLKSDPPVIPACIITDA